MSIAKFGGIMLVAGAALNLTRMIPIFIGGDVPLESIPPHTAEQISTVALLPGWVTSHVMGFLSVPLLISGFVAMYRSLDELKPDVLWIASTVFLSVGMLFYGIGVTVDGSLLPQAARQLLAATSEADKSAATMVQLITHKLAVSTGGISRLGVFPGLALLGAGLYRTPEHKIIGVSGLLVGSLGVVAMIFGVVDYRMNHNGTLSAGTLFGAQAWMFAFGVFSLLGHLNASEGKSAREVTSSL